MYRGLGVIMYVICALAYCRNPTDGMWYLFDDAHVTRVKESEILTTSAYILFYQRRSLSTSSGSSEASSSSSSGSDHWAFRLPRESRSSAQPSTDSSRSDSSQYRGANWKCEIGTLSGKLRAASWVASSNRERHFRLSWCRFQVDPSAVSISYWWSTRLI